MLPVAGEGLDGAEVAVMTLLVLVEGEGLVLLPELPEGASTHRCQQSVIHVIQLESLQRADRLI